MIRRTLAASVAAAVALAIAPPAGAAPADPEPPGLKPAEATQVASADKGTVLTLGTGNKRETYLVQLEEPPVPSYAGGVNGLAPVNVEGREYRPESSRARAYRGHLRKDQAALRRDIARVTDRAAQVRETYTEALNGLAVRLTAAEAEAVSGIEGVAAVQVDEERKLMTDVGPEWIGAPSIWSGESTPSGVGTKGEGIIAGIIDSGINAANPSFHDSVPESAGGDGYSHENPFGTGNYVGVCDPAQPFHNPDFECNDKLIGAWDFDPRDNDAVGYGYDENGHGSHTASTTAGNQVDATTYAARGTADEFSATRNIKGVAPHANIISYDVCAGGCPISAITAAIEQAILDGVDVINYSIGSSAPSNPWADPDALGFLAARDAGIHVATSAGNSGPGAATVGSPGDVPWMTTVGATQHNRQWQATVQDLTADGGATFPDIQGLAFASATDGAFPIVDAGVAFGNPLCGIEGGTADDGTFPAGTDLTGLIVVCDRGTSGRVEKGSNVASLGAEGMILANDAASGDSLNADPHALPAVHITYDDGVALKEWMATVAGEQASLSGGTEVISDSLADIMAGFSSRGPNRAVELISPSISAPGVDILAANGSDNEVSWGFISGTSMASPHIAGSLALVADEHPDWSPAEAQSALMTTSLTDVEDTDGSAADWFDMGSGRVDLTRAADAGLILDVTTSQYLASNPAAGGDVKELNTASMANAQCLEQCTWTRTVEATDTGAGSWTTSGAGVTDGIDVTVEPAQFTLAAGETQVITITADVTGSPTDAYQFGNVVLTPAEGSAAPAAHLPVAALPSTGVVPAEIDIDTRRDAGSQVSEPIEAVRITDLDIRASGLVPAEVDALSIVEDSTNTAVYDGNGVQVINVTVPEGATRFIAKLENATAPDFDLYVGKGSTPSAETQVALSASGGSAESVDFPLGDGDAGEWWILVQNWDASTPGGTDTVDLEHAVVSGDEGNLRAEGPATQPAGEPFTIRTFWDESAMEPGQTWYGSLTLDAAPGGTGIGTIPVTVDRFADAVTKSVDKQTAEPGETLTYTVDVLPNVTPEDLTYTFSDALPEGTTYVEGSGPEGATVEDGVLTWQTTMPTAVGREGVYDITTSNADPACVNPATGAAGYLDLASLGILPAAGITGDGVAFTGFSSDDFGFYEGNFEGLTFTDDGFLVYGDGALGATGDNQELPNPIAPNNVAAGLWQDMQFVYDEASGAGVSLAAGGDLKVIEFDNMRLSSDATGAQGTTDFQVVAIAGTRDIAFAYDNVGGPLADVTIGTENADGSNGSALVNGGDAAGVISDGTVVCMRYSKELDAEQFTYQVTVDEDVVDGQALTNELTHTVDNPGSGSVTVSAETVAAVSRVTVTGSDAEEPATDGLFTFTRAEEFSEEALTITYEVTDRRARAGRDYRPLDGTVTFAAGETTATETVEIIDRLGRNKKERTVTVTIVDGDSYQPGDPASSTIEIVDLPPKDRFAPDGE